MRLAEGEGHDACRQALLRAKASDTADNLARLPWIKGVLLGGSVARGPVGAASDIDLHLVVSGSPKVALPKWSFSVDGMIKNLHITDEAEFVRGWAVRESPADLAEWFYRTGLGEELQVSEVLYWSSTAVSQSRATQLLALRAADAIPIHLSRMHFDGAQRQVTHARKAIHDGAALDACQHLRYAVRGALNAVLVRRGWILRGSKKAIEIAEAFLPDAALEEVLGIAEVIVSLGNCTPTTSSEVCERRLSFRQRVQDELELLSERYASDEQIVANLKAELRRRVEHDAHAFDYYASLVLHGMLRGPVNHIRTMSGFPRVPETLLHCLGKQCEWPIQTFVSERELSSDLIDSFLRIFDPVTSLDVCADVASRITIVARGTSVDQLPQV